ncbi:peptidoglycan editing factor PgeF [Polaromonas jejuensis]|uniref:Purine nucleoside phosphorylase n=1 Tax=Polaromonas jejuensis TaxID=457502 RepID=A0ABW0QG48_9BURK|nr:peptidoglycan editing factor PgeF [Polaromonas jejuensis]
MHADWLIPDWPAPAGVRAVFTTRAGGVSAQPYDSLNLGDHVGDRPEHVAANRALLQQATGTRAVFLQQVHGCEVLALEAASPDGQPADACVTAQRRLACTIMVADCLPVLLTTEDGAVVAAAHAGWRGLAGAGVTGLMGGPGVLASVYASFRALAQAERAHSAPETIAWLGPCIGPSAFEVGAEVKAAFEAVQAGAGLLFVDIGGGKYLANLPALARLRLQAMGVTRIYGNDGSAPWCTVSNPSRFFSHRRDAGVRGNGFGTTGRMAACIWRD